MNHKRLNKALLMTKGYVAITQEEFSELLRKKVALLNVDKIHYRILSFHNLTPIFSVQVFLAFILTNYVYIGQVDQQSYLFSCLYYRYVKYYSNITWKGNIVSNQHKYLATSEQSFILCLKYSLNP